MDFEKIREGLLDDKRVDIYRDILAYLNNPNSSITEESQQYLIDMGYLGFEQEVRDIFLHNRENYRNQIGFGQAVIWEHVLVAYEALLRTKELLQSTEAVYFKNNYLKACDQVKKILEIYSDAKAAITRLENELGVDRYLDNIADHEFDILVKEFDLIHKCVEERLLEYKRLFVQKWNTTNIYDILMHRLIRSNMDNQVCSLFTPQKKHVYLFIIDGFGMGQYYWSRKVVPLNKNYAYSENIFSWLAEEKLSSEYVLGAPLVSDTAAGICQIFIGKTAADTRVISSTVKKSTGPGYVNVKGEYPNSFKEIANTDYPSFTVDIASEKEEMRIFYCSKYENDNASGFSKYVFDSADVVSVVPSERVFSYLKEDMLENKNGATVTYITNIDNSGHVMGSFSQFERYEHEKINTLLKNFLIDLANTQPERFDGETSILITADHGMTESYRINVTRKEILDVIHKVHEHAEKLIEANRALFLYGISDRGVITCKEAIKRHLECRNIDALVLSKGDSLFDDYIPNGSDEFINTTPEIMILLISEGIFYSKDVGHNLMHFGGHGGHSIDEVFVPAISIELNSNLYENISKRFLKLS